MRKIILCLLGGILAAGGLIWAAARYSKHRDESETRAHGLRLLNHPAPAVSTTTVKGTPWELSAQRGKVVVIEAWATWCSWCMADLPATKRLYEKFKPHPEFQLIGVSLDRDAEKVRRFCTANQMPWLQLVEPGRDFDSRLARAFGIKALPFTCVIDKQGVVRWVHGWLMPTSPENIEAVVERLLKEPYQATGKS